MARDPDRGDRFVFDLVDDEPAGGGAPAVGPGPGAGPDGDGDGDGRSPDDALTATGDLPARGRAPVPRALGPVAAVLAIALGTGVAVDGVRDAERIERIREVPNGVVDVSSRLGKTWVWEGTVGSDQVAGEMMVADLGGVLAFQSADELVALDPASGEQAWSVPLGEDSECGPVDFAGVPRPATSGMVCLEGAASGRQARVVGSDGATSAPRTLDPAHERRYGTARPGPEGTVLRAMRVGPGSAVDVGDARCVEATGECTGTVEAGRDLLLRAEDALTGEERWSVTIPFLASEAQDCTPWFGNPWEGWDDASAEQALAPDAFGAQIGTDLVEIWGCGVWAAVTPDGALLRTQEASGPDATVSLGGDRYALATTDVSGEAPSRTVLLASDGTTLGEIPGYVSSPLTTDGVDGTMLFGVDASGSHLRSYAADGSQRWDVVVSPETSATEFLAQVAGTVLTSTWTGSFRALDLATGEERWTWDPAEVLEEASYEGGYVARVFTDGRSLLLPLYGDDGAVELASIDATSGELGWSGSLADVTGPGDPTILIAVGGHLLAVTPRGVTGLG